MRLVHLTLPGGKRDAVLDALDDLGIDYAAVEEVSSGSYEELVFFPLPNDAVEPTLDRFREIGLDDEAFTVITAAESIVSERFDALRERYDEGQPAERVAHEEIRSQAREFIPANATFALLVIVAAVVAAAGLLLDSPAVVVGSMVIAPLTGATGAGYAASYGTNGEMAAVRRATVATRRTWVRRTARGPRPRVTARGTTSDRAGD